jgi:hypothetical protein
MVGIVASSREASLCEASSLGGGGIAFSPLAQLAPPTMDTRRRARLWIDASDSRAMAS